MQARSRKYREAKLAFLTMLVNQSIELTDDAAQEVEEALLRFAQDLDVRFDAERLPEMQVAAAAAMF